MLKGINQWCYPEGTPLEKVFEYSKNAGFESVELNFNPSGGIGFTLDTKKEEAEEIKSLAESYGLKLNSLSTALFWQYPLCAKDEQLRKQAVEMATKMLEIASYIDVETLLVVPGVVNEQMAYDECYAISQQSLKELVPVAEKYEVQIGVENVWNKFLLSPVEMVRYIDEINSKYVGAYFDVGNILQYGYPEQWIRILGDRIFKIHVKDFKTNVGNGAGFVPLLAGSVNWPEVIKALQEIDYNGPLTAELSPYSISPEALPRETSLHLDIILSKGDK